MHSYCMCASQRMHGDGASEPACVGCQVWLDAQLDAEGRVQLAAGSDSELTRGMCTLLTNSLNGLKPDDFLQVRILQQSWSSSCRRRPVGPMSLLHGECCMVLNAAVWVMCLLSHLEALS